MTHELPLIQFVWLKKKYAHQFCIRVHFPEIIFFWLSVHFLNHPVIAGSSNIILQPVLLPVALDSLITELSPLGIRSKAMVWSPLRHLRSLIPSWCRQLARPNCIYSGYGIYIYIHMYHILHLAVDFEIKTSNMAVPWQAEGSGGWQQKSAKRARHIVIISFCFLQDCSIISLDLDDGAACFTTAASLKKKNPIYFMSRAAINEWLGILTSYACNSCNWVLKIFYQLVLMCISHKCNCGGLFICYSL